MTSSHHIFDLMLRKFESRAPLDESDREALRSLPHGTQVLEPSGYIVREGQVPERCCLILSGFAFRHKVTINGARQIISVHIPGDFVDLDGALLNVADHNVQVFTRCEIACVPRQAMRDLIESHPKIAMALWIDSLIDASIFREWVVNVGRRDARARVAHLLCEIARRLEIAGLASEYGYELPMTQEQLGDATGLTSVHINRVLMGLGREGLITRDKREVTLSNWEELRKVGGFSESYLHLDQVGRVAPSAIPRPLLKPSAELMA